MPRVETFEREEAIRNAMEVFWEKGYNGTSIQDLVDATGLNRSSIYNSFGSKQELYKLSLEFYEGENNKMFQKLLLKSSTSLEAIRKILESSIPAILEDEEGKGCFIMNCKSELGSSDETLRQWLVNNQDRSVSLFTELVRDGQENGLINQDQDADKYAYDLFNTFQGLRMTGMLTQDKGILQNIIDNALKNIQ